MTNVSFNHYLNEDFRQAFQTEKAILQKKIRKQKEKVTKKANCH